MSSEPKPPVRRHSSSTVAGKNGGTVEVLVTEDYYTRYPNRWAKIRSATT